MATQSDMAKSTHELLQQRGFAAEMPFMSRKTISTKVEQGKKYSVTLSQSLPSVIYQVDKNIIRSGKKCDRLILIQDSKSEEKEEWKQIFVEQKGTDVRHAIEQLIATIKQPVFLHKSNIERRACVVATNFPANTSDPKIETLKQELGKLGVSYKQLKNGQIDRL